MFHKFKLLILNLILALTYFAIAKLGLALATLNNSVSPVWPATGFAIAMVYLFGNRVLWSIGLGAFLANATTDTSILIALFIAIGNTLEAFVGSTFFRWAHSQRRQFTYYTNAISYFGASVFGSVVSATIGSLTLFGFGIVSKEALEMVWLTWWIGDALGGLILTPLLITQIRKSHFTFNRLVLTSCISLLAFSVTYFVFVSSSGGSYLFLIFPVLYLSVKFLSRAYVYFLSGFMAVFGVVATIKGLGPCAVGTLNERLVHIQLFIAMVALTSLTLAAIGRRKLSLYPSAVLMVCWLFAGSIFYSFDQSGKNQSDAHFRSLVKSTQEKIEEALEDYEGTLRGAAGLFTASQSVGVSEWRNYNQLLQLTHQHSGMNGIGIIWPVKKAEVSQFSAKMKKQGFKDFQIKPIFDQEPSSNDHYVIKMIEPYELNKKAIGIDISTEKNRRNAAEMARDLGVGTMTSKVNIRIEDKLIPGFHLYFPIYSKIVQSETVEERRKAHLGWVFSPVVYQNFFAEIFNRTNGEIELEAFEGDIANPDNVVYSNFSKNHSSDQIVTQGEVGRKLFSFRWKKSAHFESAHDTIVAWVGLCGALASLLMTSLMVSVQLVGQRAREMAQELTKELTESRERFKAGERRLLYALDGSNDGIWDWNLERSEMYVSGKIAETFAWPQVFRLKTSDDLRKVAHLDDLKAMTASVRRHMEGLQDFHEVETRYRTKDGVWRWVLTRGKISERDSKGNPVRMTGVHIDIDALKKAQQLLQSTQNQLRHIADSVPTLVAELDSNLKCKFANSGFANWFNLTPEQTIGKHISELLSMEEFGARVGHYEMALAGQIQRYEKQALRKSDGEARHMVTLCLPNIINGKTEGLFLFVQDVTELKLAELAAIEERKVAQEATNIKSQFLANMSHEIRTPINGIIGMTNLLKATELTPRQKEYTDLVSRSSDMLLNLINDILDFSKIEAGKLELEIINFDLSQLASDVQNALSFSANEKGLLLKLENSLTPSSYFKGDPSRLRQVMMNLLSNAIKFTGNGEVTLAIDELKSERGSSWLRFEVRDTGIGIPEHSLNRLFQAFSQADSTTSRRFGGTGLGLSICKQLVHLMNGKIGVESRPGQGSTFWFELCLSYGEFVELESPSTAQVELTKGARILVAEDNRVNQQIAFEALKSLGYHPHVVGSGIEALDALRESQYDLILMDCQMPEMDGYKATEIIRKSDSINSRSIPIVAMTANALGGEREKCLEVGMNDYISKPIRENVLIKVIESQLSLVKTNKDDQKTLSKNFLGKILVVEDNIVNQNVICANLEILSYSFEVAGNGYEALEKLKSGRYDLILMDCQMPRMDGYEATRKIRKSAAEYAEIPIVALTANALRGDREKCLAAGMSDYLTKPLNVELLKQTLESWIKGKKLRKKDGFLKDSISTQVIELEAIQMLKRLQKPGRPDLVTSLIDLFFESADEGIKKIRTCIQAKDWKGVSAAAHSLKSSSANLGAMSMSKICVQLEALLDSSLNEKIIFELFSSLENEYVKVVTELKGLRVAG